MPTTHPPTFDWKKGSVFVQEGIIYYSPNHKSPVKIEPPTRRQPHPFLDAKVLDAKAFKQPVWWTDSWGWMSFIPLNPSFITIPFRDFCWMPPIEERVLTSSEKSQPTYRMNKLDAEAWRQRERDVLEAALKLRLWYHVPASQPPTPSSFKYDIYYSTREEAVRQITLARQWFAVWMGLLSYFVARAKYAENCVGRMVPKATDLLPRWYTRLEEELGMSPGWLDGLRYSTVCQFDVKTPRAGIVLPWYEYEKNRPNLEFFIEHCVPVFFPWCAVAEDSIIRNPSLAYLKPPTEMVNAAVDKLLTKHASTRVPLAALICRTYFVLHKLQWHGTKHVVNMDYATSEIFEYMRKEYVYQYEKLQDVLKDDARKQTEADLQGIVASILEEQRAAAEEAVEQFHEEFKPLAPLSDPNSSGVHSAFGDAFDMPLSDTGRGVTLERDGGDKGDGDTGDTEESWSEDDEGDTLYESVEAFLEKRHLGQLDIIKNTETPAKRDKRRARERKRPVLNAKMFLWREKFSSRGKMVHVRQRLEPTRGIYEHTDCPEHRRIYNAFDNEWDLLLEVDVPKKWIQGTVISEETDWEYMNTEGSDPPPAPRENVEVEVESMEVSNAQADVDVVRGVEGYQYKPGQTYNGILGNTATSDDIEDCHDLLRSLFYCYGFTPSTVSGEQEGRPDIWARCLATFSFKKNGVEKLVSNADRHSIALFREVVVSGQQIPREICDLVPGSPIALGDLVNLKIMHRPSSNMFVFCHDEIRAPPELIGRMTVDWHIGVETPLAALYVCHLFSQNHGHTVYTVARELLEKGVPFRTLIGRDIREGVRQVSQPYQTKSFYRGTDHVFGAEDFNASMSVCEDVLTQIHGRAALLMGGIVGRIAKDYLSLGAALSGPSTELTRYGVGFITDSGSKWVPYCDDGLTEYEIMTIVGAYTLMTNYTNQASVKTWFPSPQVWNDHRNGAGGVEWTEKNEQWYLRRVELIRAGKEQPKTKEQWKQTLRNKLNRDFQVNAEAMAEDFVNQNVPVVGCK